MFAPHLAVFLVAASLPHQPQLWPLAFLMVDLQRLANLRYFSLDVCSSLPFLNMSFFLTHHKVLCFIYIRFLDHLIRFHLVGIGTGSACKSSCIRSHPSLDPVTSSILAHGKALIVPLSSLKFTLLKTNSLSNSNASLSFKFIQCMNVLYLFIGANLNWLPASTLLSCVLMLVCIHPWW